MKKFKLLENTDRLKVVGLIFLTQVIVSIIYLLINGTGHPFLGYIKDLQFVIQLFATSFFAFIVYAIPGYILALAVADRRRLLKYIDFAVIALAVFLFIVFVAVYAQVFVSYQKTTWLLYSVVNPMFGNVIYETITRSLWGLSWVVSAIVPSLGLLFGVFIRLRQEGVIEG